MANPWQIYDQLIDQIPADITVDSTHIGLQWTRVTSSESGIGMAYTTPIRTRPQLHEGGSFAGASLREIAALAKSWNLAEASLGVAAINAYFGQAGRAEASGCQPCNNNFWPHMFDPYLSQIEGKKVVVVGHFPFAPKALSGAGELVMLEREPQSGDFPDSACEYVLPECDFAFITSSAFVNKTAPRLFELAKNAFTVALGPSTPLSPVLFDHGVDALLGFVSPTPEKLDEALANLDMRGMHEAGRRVELSRA